MIEYGDPVPLTITIRNAAGTPEDATTVSLTITRPDLTTITSPTDFAIAHTALSGIYSYTYLPTQIGLHPSARWVATGINAGAWDEPFTVEQPGRAFINATEAIAELRSVRIPTRPADIEQLRWYCRVASNCVEHDLSRTIAPRAMTEVFDGGQCAVILAHGPVQSVTTVVDSGTTLTASDYVLSVKTGILYRGSQTSPTRFLTGRGTTSVTYVVGYTSPPPIVRKVALRGVVRMWQLGQQLTHPALDDIGAESVGYAIGTLTPLELDAYKSLRRLAIS